MKTLKPFFLLTILMLGVSSFSFAQNGYEKGEKDLNLGLNLGWGIGAVAAFDFAVADDISVGAGLSFSGQNSFTYFSISGRGSYHFARLFDIDSDVSDPYAGLAIGYRNVSSAGDAFGIYDDLVSDVFFGGYVGYRFTLNDKLGLYAELGYPLSSLGVVFSF